jgi:integrin beta 8
VGADGKTVLNGTGAPAGSFGAIGDFYIDTTTNPIYGPKAAGGWGNATNLVGPHGATGPPGTVSKQITLSARSPWRPAPSRR